MYYMSLVTEVSKGFLISTQLRFRSEESSERKEMRYAHNIGEKEHIEILLAFRMLFRQ